MTAPVLRLVRDAAADPEVEAAIRETGGPGRMTLQGSCLVLGLAAVTALDANIGKAAAAALGGVKKRAEGEKATTEAATERERQRSAAVAAVEAERPKLSPMPADAWGEAAK